MTPKTNGLSTSRLFWDITWRTTAGLWGAAWLVQGLFMILLAGYGFFAAGTNLSPSSFGLVDFMRASLAIFFLALVGGVASGFFSLPVGLALGVSSGVLVSLITRWFFYPLHNISRYRLVITAVMLIYCTLCSWLGFMGLYLLIARDNRIQSPLVPWLALGAALIAGFCTLPVSSWIARWYSRWSKAFGG